MCDNHRMGIFSDEARQARAAKLQRLQEKSAQQTAKLNAFNDDHKYDSKFGPYRLTLNVVYHGLHQWPADQCHAELVLGGKRQRMTITRIGAGALLAGPVGALVGGMAKKDTTKNWLILVTPDGVKQTEVNSKEIGKAQAFVKNLEESAARLENE